MMESQAVGLQQFMNREQRQQTHIADDFPSRRRTNAWCFQTPFPLEGRFNLNVSQGMPLAGGLKHKSGSKHADVVAPKAPSNLVRPFDFAQDDFPGKEEDVRVHLRLQCNLTIVLR
jgi:hypothetical protein